MSEQVSFKIIEEGTITTPQGFTAGGLHCGLKKTDRNDLGAVVSSVPATAAAVYTLNSFQAAPIGVCKASIGVDRKLQGIIVNSGNANACTGAQGVRDAEEMQSLFAKTMGLQKHHVGVASTGVIGELMPMDKVRSGIQSLPSSISERGGEEFCQAILTTDLVKKTACVQLQIDGKVVYISGVAKGSGMIEPNMATMLGFITTDAAIESDALQQVLGQVTEKTFNMITVDGDTSTNDTVMVMANGLANNDVLSPEHPEWSKFADGMQYVAEQLAKKIARDGEGATKLVEVIVNGAATDQDARAIAKTVIGSSLVKSAAFGADANWGRIIAAVGRSGVSVLTDRVDIWVGDFLVLQQSKPMIFAEDAAEQYLQGDEVQYRIELNMGEGHAVAWGCDLTYEYVRINAAYRT